MASSTKGRHKIEIFLVAGAHPEKTGDEQPHEEFANMRDDEAAAQAFVERWGPLAKRIGPLFHQPNLGFRDMLRKAWRGDKDALQEIQRWVNQYMITSFAFERGRIEVVPNDLLSTIFLLFLRDHAAGKTAICGNPDCAAPFFLRNRSTQQFCGVGPCAAFGQRKRALHWWHAEGKKQRDEKRTKIKNRGGKAR